MGGTVEGGGLQWDRVGHGMRLLIGEGNQGGGAEDGALDLAGTLQSLKRPLKWRKAGWTLVQPLNRPWPRVSDSTLDNSPCGTTEC